MAEEQKNTTGSLDLLAKAALYPNCGGCGQNAWTASISCKVCMSHSNNNATSRELDDIDIRLAKQQETIDQLKKQLEEAMSQISQLTKRQQVSDTVQDVCFEQGQQLSKCKRDINNLKASLAVYAQMLYSDEGEDTATRRTSQPDVKAAQPLAHGTFEDLQRIFTPIQPVVRQGVYVPPVSRPPPPGFAPHSYASAAKR